ncbi:MAG TPA: AMP nucleosidase, partial [Mucilaginibacter sp.]|nr:AMP nucleosidase [Mucilaginibacter sp.]
MNEQLDVKKDDQPAKSNSELKETNSAVTSGLKTKEAIVTNWLPRYTGRNLEAFGKYIILTNFSKYIQLFS